MTKQEAKDLKIGQRVFWKKDMTPGKVIDITGNVQHPNEFFVVRFDGDEDNSYLSLQSMQVDVEKLDD